MTATHAICLRPAPEAYELPYRRRELAALRAELAGREDELTALRNRVHVFEGRYIRQVAVLYVQLDEWRDRIAALNNPAPSVPLHTPSSPPEAETAAESPIPDPASALDLDLKSLFREVARRVHPDHARDADDEHHRNQLMAQANAALLRQDAALLHRMLHSHDLPMEAADARTELAQTRALIQHLQRDLAAIQSEMEALWQSEMADLQRRTESAALQGQDLLAELAAQVKGSIGLAMRQFELDQERIRRRQKRLDPESLLSAETPAAR